MSESISRELHTGATAPRLLVSVRCVDEAGAAIAGGCGILDVKEPRRGALGMADVSCIEQVLQAGRSAGVPVSAALGEVIDYAAFHNEPLRPLPPCLSGLAFVKMGLSGLVRQRNWTSLWRETMLQLTQSLTGSKESTVQPPGWVAVIYADWQRAEAPSPDAIVDAVLSAPSTSDHDFVGVLVDTWSKQSGRLPDSLSVERLTRLSRRVQDSGRFFAVAGRLTAATLPDLFDVQPDIIGVRSAACRNEDRASVVAEDSVRRLRECIDEVFLSGSEHAVLPVGASRGQF